MPRDAYTLAVPHGRSLPSFREPVFTSTPPRDATASPAGLRMRTPAARHARSDTVCAASATSCRRLAGILEWCDFKWVQIWLGGIAITYLTGELPTRASCPHGRVAHLAKTPPKPTVANSMHAITQRHNSLLTSKEAQIQLALQAIKQDANLSERRAAQIYSVNRRTLANRRAGKQSRRDCAPNSANLRPTEEEVIVQHILDLNARGFPPRLAAVKDIADLLRKERGQPPVGVNWASTFVKRCPKLKVKFNRKYDYKRALCEDPGVIQG
jgi:hypothetical protein